MSKLAVLTSGGDSPGMNATIRSVVRTALYQNLQVLGVSQGFYGLLHQSFLPLELRSVANIIQRGGTFLKTRRCPEFMQKEARQQAIENLESAGVSKLVVIGGDGSLLGAKALFEESAVSVCGIPASIDNDICGSDYSIGFDTSVNTALNSIDKIRDTAASHDRVFIVEVMGRNTGFLAAHVGLAGGAEAVFIPEKAVSVDDVASKLSQSSERGKSSSLLIAAEGQKPGRAYDLAEALRKKAGIEAKVCVLGHIQRGGTPSGRDRILGSQMGAAAINSLIQNRSGHFIAVQNGALVEQPLKRVEDKKALDPTLLPLTEILAQ